IRHPSIKPMFRQSSFAVATSREGHHLPLGGPGRFNPSLGDCPGAPNSRWPLASAALPVCGRACARSRPGGAGSARDCCRRSWLTASEEEAPAGGGWGQASRGHLAERIGNVELNPLLCLIV